MISTGQAKIAILPFSYLDKRKSEGGSIVSERLTTRIVKLKKYQVIERELLENLIQEQHLETSGAVSAETAKQIGKILGVDAIISGTLLDVEDGMVEVNARLIKTETAEVLNTASVSIKKIWSDVSIAPPPPHSQPAPQQEQAVQEEQQPMYKQPATRRGGPKLDTYVDLFTGLGGGSGKMDLTFNNNSGIPSSNLDIYWQASNNSSSYSVSRTYTKYSFSGVNMDGTAPIGARIVGYGKHWGFDMECSYYSATMPKQVATVTYGNSPSTYNDSNSDYFKMSVFNLISMDLLYRFTNKMIQPYVGVGIGMSLGSVSSPYILQEGGGSLDEFTVGFLLRSPIIGVRVNVGDSTTLFIEQRSITDYTYFSRSYASENDTVALSVTQTILGVGFKFN